MNFDKKILAVVLTVQSMFFIPVFGSPGPQENPAETKNVIGTATSYVRDNVKWWFENGNFSSGIEEISSFSYKKAIDLRIRNMTMLSDIQFGLKKVALTDLEKNQLAAAVALAASSSSTLESHLPERIKTKLQLIKRLSDLQKRVRAEIGDSDLIAQALSLDTLKAVAAASGVAYLAELVASGFIARNTLINLLKSESGAASAKSSISLTQLLSTVAFAVRKANGNRGDALQFGLFLVGMPYSIIPLLLVNPDPTVRKASDTIVRGVRDSAR